MKFKTRESVVSIVAMLVGVTALACGSATPTPLPVTQSQAAQVPAAAPQPTVAPQPTTAAVSAPAPQAASTDESQQQAAFTWSIEDVDSGTKPALALTSDGTPHVAYMLEAQNGFVKSAVRAGAAWDITTVATGYFYGPLDISIGPDDVAHIIYHDHQDSRFQPDLGDIVLAVQEGGQWRVNAIFHAGHDGWDSRLFVDGLGKVHIAGIDSLEFGGHGVDYFTQDGSGKWIGEDIGSGPLTYKYAVSVAADSEGNPYITFFDQGPDDLVLASRDDAGWTIVTVDDQGDTGLFSSLVIDEDGRFHISYLEKKSRSSGLVKYATRGPGDSDWEIREIDALEKLTFGMVGARNITSVARDSQGNPWVAYSDESSLKLAVWDGARWRIDTVVDAGSKTLGQLVSLKLDSNDRPHIAYFEVNTKGPLTGVIKYTTGTPR